MTSDSLLHLNHLVFDSLLRETETKNLLPATVELAAHYLRASIQQSRSAPALREDALANVAYWSVVARLLRGEVATGLQDPPSSADADEAAKLKANRAKNIAAMNALTASLGPILSAVPPEAKLLANAEIALIKAHEGREPSPIFGENWPAWVKPMCRSWTRALITPSFRREAITREPKPCAAFFWPRGGCPARRFAPAPRICGARC